MMAEKTDAEIRKRFAANSGEGVRGLCRPAIGQPVAIAVARDQAHVARVRLSRRRHLPLRLPFPDGTTVFVGGALPLDRSAAQIVFSWIIEPPDEHAGIESEVTATITPRDGGAANCSSATKSSARSDAVARHARLAGRPGGVDRTARGGFRMTSDDDLQEACGPRSRTRARSTKSRCSAGSASC